MFKIIPCTCLIWLLLNAVGAQTSLPTAYSRSTDRAAINTAAAASTLGKVQLYLAPSSENESGKESFVLEAIKGSAKRLERQKVKRKRPKKMLQLIRHEVENRYLRHYQSLSDFSRLFKDNHYNELTAAALTSMLLQELEIDHQLFLFQQEVRITLADGTVLEIESWGRNRPLTRRRAGEQSHLIELVDALQLPPESEFRQSILAPYRSDAEKKALSPGELSGMLYYRRALDFYLKRQYAAALIALDRAGTYFADPKLELIRYVILYQQAKNLSADSKLIEPLFKLYRLHSSPGIAVEMVHRFAELAEYYLLEKGDQIKFEDLYTAYRQLFAEDEVILQQLKEIYFIEMAQFHARRYEPHRVIGFLDSLNTYRPEDPQIQKILAPLLVQSLSGQKDPEKGLAIIEVYRKDFPFLQKDTFFRDVELSYRAERTRKAFDADRGEQGRNYLVAFEQQLAKAGLTPRSKLWIVTAYTAASAFYFRNADYINARWHIQRALALVPDDDFLLHRQEVLRNY
jgi:hypothetical protein